VQKVFAAESDTAPRLLATFRPTVATALYKAWGAIETAASPIQVFAMRTKASLFGHNAPLQIQFSPAGVVLKVQDWPVVESSNQVYLDSNYDKITPVFTKGALPSGLDEIHHFGKVTRFRSNGNGGISLTPLGAWF